MPPKYGQKQQLVKPKGSTPRLDQCQTKFIQEVTRTFLFYAQAVDSTTLTALSALAREQAAPTKSTFKKIKQFVYYAATNSKTIIMYRESEKILGAHSNASYLSESKARGRAGGHFFLSTNTAFLPNNGAVHNAAQTLKHVISLAVEAKLGALLINSKLAMQL